jgi:hypothetical protein
MTAEPAEAKALDAGTQVPASKILLQTDSIRRLGLTINRFGHNQGRGAPAANLNFDLRTRFGRFR